MRPLAERLVNFAKKHNGILHPAEYRKEEVRVGHSIPGGAIMNHLKNPRLFKKVSAGEYRLVGRHRQ